MVNSDEVIDDFDIADDVEEQWDDDIDFDEPEGEISAPLDGSSKYGNNAFSKIFKLLLALSILGGGGYFIYIFLANNGNPKQIPIVKISKIDEIKTEDNNSIIVNTDIVESKDVINNDELLLLEPTAQLKQDNPIGDKHISVLTPMPNINVQNKISLSELIVVSKHEDAIRNQISSDSINNRILNEAELQAKIDTNFDKKISSTVEDKVINNDIVVEKKSNAIINGNTDISPSEQTKTEELPIVTLPVKDNKKPIIDIAKKDPIVVKPKEIVKSKAISKVKKPKWIIRAAQSGSALIYDKTSREMKSIEVSDMVNGLGRIKSIKIIDGVWVVTGTLGRIEQ